jgi:predicted ATPase
LPATLCDLLRGRVQTLPEPAQHVLKVVAVADGGCRTGWLAAVAGLDDRQLDGALRAAVTSQLLVARPGQDGYDLRHALLREVIDADLLLGERARLHAALAHNLADLLGSGELDWSSSAAEVAVHWDRTHDLPKALEWSVRAAFASSALASRPPR